MSGTFSSNTQFFTCSSRVTWERPRARSGFAGLAGAEAVAPGFDYAAPRRAKGVTAKHLGDDRGGADDGEKRVRLCLRDALHPLEDRGQPGRGVGGRAGAQARCCVSAGAQRQVRGRRAPQRERAGARSRRRRPRTSLCISRRPRPCLRKAQSRSPQPRWRRSPSRWQSRTI